MAVYMMVAAADISWLDGGLNEHLAITMGEKKSVDSIFRQFGHEDGIHMRALKNHNTRNEIVNRLSLHGGEILALCIRTERNATVKMVKERLKDNRSTGRIWTAFDYALFHQIELRLEKYLSMHGHELYEVPFQCDKDCRSIVRTRGLKCVDPSNMHSLADIIAWGNIHNNHPSGVIELDLADQLRGHIVKKFIK